ncbi:PTS system mannose/fructose/N-acetylgalactosamine-transporter subunit IIB [Lactiplantibacillus pentosus]|jgi:PTS system mannose-specific IIB component|uniref:PTS system mannose/fructose/N-acetylgalactosamine-transporter subunit IIB n=1 Tax=Lactiplantibacillus pentosus TaxID=1589 RepID=UPI000D01570D|nr:PTS sugar transporter subunit IIB [Lactiplantibacillus pentosus]MCS8604475.1 PTS mannose/fructose/sorbose transporter subunit IIB [Lactiplantibacillus pentosus]PRO86942.1 PTS mannose/fructose/sorbose transporter subunit IIB [Lactiplantibacillus pentosus]
MIKMLRIDDRLIHGQVAVTWSKQLDVNRIVVVSDTISQDEIQISALKMAAPEGIKSFVLSVDKAAKMLNDPRAKALKVLVVMNDPVQVESFLNKLEVQPGILDIANYGRVAGLTGRDKVTDTVYLSEEEKEVFKRLSAQGSAFIYQPLPNDSVKNLDSLLEA